MVKGLHFLLFVSLFTVILTPGYTQSAGGIRGVVYDQDFDVPLPAARVQIAETGQEVETSDEGNYVFNELEPGTYTLVFFKIGYTRQVDADVVVSAGALTEVNASLSGDFTDMEEFVVQEVQFGAGTEVGLLELKIGSATFLDTVSSELMSQAGASDAAAALTLVSGATVEDGKFPVIRGLPDRYVNTQLNGIRLPTADAEKRAVELDQFPASAIDSIQVSKTFTPDQQGDASGGAVNVILKSVPDENFLKFSLSSTYNTETSGNDDFLTYRGGGVSTWGLDEGERDIQEENIGSSWDGAVGVKRDDAPIDYKVSIAAGGRYEFDNDVTIGALGSFYYERDSQYIEDAVDDKWWVENPGDEMTPQYSQGTPDEGDFVTSLYDVDRGEQQVNWGALGVLGVETENHSLTLTGLYTRNTSDEAILAENTRGKEYYYPGYDPDNQSTPGHEDRFGSPYLRLQTLAYTERETQTIQLAGKHKLPDPGLKLDGFLELLGPEVDWSISRSKASYYQPDKVQFGSLWVPQENNPGRPPFSPPFTRPESYFQFKPAANFTLGNLQRSYREIVEISDQHQVNIKFPFTQWTDSEGYVKFGIFNDQVRREYDQESFSNFSDNGEFYQAPWDELWSDVFGDETNDVGLSDHPIKEGNVDVDYKGEQEIEAWYYMVDLPLTSFLNIIGGMRYETTVLSIVNTPEEDVFWIPPDEGVLTQLKEGDADVDFKRKDMLPSIGFKLQPIEQITLRGSYSETVARQTFRELSPIIQQEFLGGDVFIGNPNLQMSDVENYDLRLDYNPYPGGLVSVSWFKKDITNPIEYVQRVVDFGYTTPVNYPEGELSGWEFELKQQMGELLGFLEGLTLGGNATFIESEVTVSPEEQELFASTQIQAPIEKRDMTNAPEHLYNVYFVYAMDKIGLKGTKASLFYTVRGDTLVAGAGAADGRFVPSVYETEFGTLNATLSQKIGEAVEIKFQAKNILNPDIETVYRSEFIESDVVKTSYKKGIDFSLGVSATF